MLEREPQRMPLILRDVAECLATGTYRDTAGAIDYHVSGSPSYISDTLTALRNDALARGDQNGVNTVQRIANENGVGLQSLAPVPIGGNLAKFSVGGLFTGSAVDYIRSRIDEGAPEFDLDWEH